MSQLLLKNIIVLALSLFCAMPVLAKEALRIIDGAVTKVSDGDTIHVTDHVGTKIKVRLYGIDCPETEKSNKRTGKVSKAGQPYGEEAFQALLYKILRQNVRLEVMAVDQYRRAVSIVTIGNRNINKEMVAEGWAWAYRQYLDRPYASEYIQAEDQARRAKRGLWQQYNPQPPWEFRKFHKKGQEW